MKLILIVVVLGLFYSALSAHKKTSKAQAEIQAVDNFQSGNWNGKNYIPLLLNEHTIILFALGLCYSFESIYPLQ